MLAIKIMICVIAYVVTNLFLWGLTAYLDSRYLISSGSEDENFYVLEKLQDLVLVSIGCGIVISIGVLFTHIGKRLKSPKFNLMAEIAKAGKKHGEQDRDLTYQAEKALLDNK